MINSRRSISGKYMKITLSLPEERMSNIKVMNLLGQTVISKWENLSAGSNDIRIGVGELQKGTYRVIINVEEGLLKEDFFIVY